MLSSDNVSAVLAHLVAAELADQRGQSRKDILDGVHLEESLTDGSLAADSLEILALARRVSEFFQLHQVGSEEWLLRRRSLIEWRDIVHESLAAEIDCVGFRSGGTTGEPELRPRGWPHLQSEVAGLALHVPQTRRILCLPPLHHIYGFIWGPLLSDQLGCELVHGTAAEILLHSGLKPGDLIIGVPEWWQYLAGVTSAFPEGVSGVSSTAPCPSATCHQLRESGLERLLEIYGASDLGGVGWREVPEAPYQLLPHWHRYDEQHLADSAGHTLALPDHVSWEDERHLRPVGRRDGAVQVGGVNVWPEQVRQCLLEHEVIKDCAIRPMQTSSGTRLKAFIVPAAGRGSLETELRAWLRDTLSAPERPNHLSFGEALPRNDMGKLCDW